MRRDTALWSRPVVVLGLVALLAAACAEPTHEERVARMRARYEATLNGFVVEQKPLEMAEGEMVEGEMAEGEAMEAESSEPEMAEGAMAEGEMMGEAEEPMPLRQDVLLDIVIRHDSADKLPGITVDITMADGERELETWRVWIDTAELDKGPGVQYSHTLEDVDYQPGYGFSAEIRYPVPPAERSQYKEFTPAGQ